MRARFHHFRSCAARGAGRDDRHRPFGGGDRDGKVARRRDDGAKPELRSRKHLRAALCRRNVRCRFCASGAAAPAPPDGRAPADAGAARPGRGARRARPRLGQRDLLPRERGHPPSRASPPHGGRGAATRTPSFAFRTSRWWRGNDSGSASLPAIPVRQRPERIPSWHKKRLAPAGGSEPVDTR